MSYDPEIVRALLGGEQEYHEDLRQRHGAAPIFERALEKQREMQVSELDEEDLNVAWVAHQELLRELDAQVVQEGILNQIVMMSGEGLEIPKLETNLAVAASFLSVRDQPELTSETIDTYFATQEVRGLFSGFTVRFVPNDVGKYVPNLSYQVLVRTTETPHMTANLYATGVVGKTGLSFLEDQRKEEVGPLLEALYTLCQGQEKSLSLIITALMGAEQYDASRIRHIGYHIDKIIKSVEKDKTQLVGDGLIDLLGRFIESGEQIHLETREYACAETGEKVQFNYYDSAKDTQLYELAGRGAGFLFMRRPIISDSTVSGYLEYDSLHVAFTHGLKNIYVPLTEVQSWK